MRSDPHPLSSLDNSLGLHGLLRASSGRDERGDSGGARGEWGGGVNDPKIAVLLDEHGKVCEFWVSQTRPCRRPSGATRQHQLSLTPEQARGLAATLLER